MAGAEPDLNQEALAAIAAQWPGREVVGVPMRAAPMQGGAIHCLTRQVPRRPPETAPERPRGGLGGAWGGPGAGHRRSWRIVPKALDMGDEKDAARLPRAASTMRKGLQ